MEMLDHLMNMKILEEGEGALTSFFKGRYYHEFTKVIYITEGLEEEMLDTLANLVDLTVLIPKEQTGDYVEQAKGYTVMTLSVESLEKKSHNIDI